MATKRSNNAALNAEMKAEIERLRQPLLARREIITQELAAICALALKVGGSVTTAFQPLDEDERAARDHAQRLIGGAAPGTLSLSLPPMISKERELQRERRGIDIVLKTLDDKELIVRAGAAVAWAEEHGEEWRRLCHDVTLTEIRKAALDQRVEALLRQVDVEFQVPLPMCEFMGRGATVGDLTAAAIAAGIVSKSEVREAENVE